MELPIDVKGHVVIVGAGPIGIEMAVAAVIGGWNVTLIEKEARIAANVHKWGFVRLFSSWQLNMSARCIGLLESLNVEVPPLDEYPTGLEFIERYLTPLKNWLLSTNRCTLLTNTHVLSIGKGRLLKGDMQPSTRNSSPFHILLANEWGDEQMLISDAVIDASGTYGNANKLGLGGLPAINERKLDSRIDREIPDVLGADRERFIGTTTVVVGSGYSAITTISLLHQLAREMPEASIHIVWATRRNDELYEVIPSDPLPQRAALSALGNGISNGEVQDTPNLNMEHIGGVQLESLCEAPNNQINLVFLEHREGVEDSKREVLADNIIAQVGYRPDTSIFQELHVHQCYASEGPMKLAASLLAANGSADCLQQTAPEAQTLMNPEPNFFIIGMKSYGRSSKFLLRIGHEQIEHVLSLLPGMQQ